MTILADVIRPVSGRAGADTTLPVYSVTKHSGFVPQSTYFKKKIASADTSAYKVVRQNQFAYATIHLDEGSIGVAPEDCIVSPMYTVFSIDESQVDPHYLERLLRSPSAVSRYQGLGRGSAERRKSVSLKALGQLSIPLPNIADQRRIASILDEADAIRTKRRAQLAHLQELPQALFHETFGDPSGASEVTSFASVASLSAGRNVIAKSHSVNPTYRVLKISAVTSGIFKPEESKPLPLNYNPPLSHVLRKGDLLMSRANTTELVGSVAYVETSADHLVLPDKVWRFEWKDNNSSPLFYSTLFSTPTMRGRISELSTGSGGSMKNIAKSKLEHMLLPRISTARQHEFTEILEAIRAERDRVARALEANNELFAALQHRAFRGEL